MKLSIIIPIHNEGAYIGETLRRLMSLDLPIKKEVIVINDGSTDNTLEILRKIGATHEFILIDHSQNLGKGAAIQSGLEKISGELLLIQDGDLEYNPNQIHKLLAKMTQGVTAVYGNRGTKRWPKRGLHYVIGAKILTSLVNILYHQHLEDVYTGYKLFNLEEIKKETLRNLRSTGFEFEAEVTCRILRLSGKIIETPIDYAPRNKIEGKKIRFKDALKGFYVILRNF